MLINWSYNKTIRININTDYFDFEPNSRRTLKPKFDANGVDDGGPLFIDFSTRRLRTRYNDTLQVNASKELGTTFDCKGLKTGSVLSLDSTTKLLDFKYDSTYFDVGTNNIYLNRHFYVPEWIQAPHYLWLHQN